MHQFTKGKLLSIITAILFVGSTIFFSSAAAQKIMQSIPSKPGQVKGVIKSTQAAGNDSLLANDNKTNDENQSDSIENTKQPQLSIQDTRSGRIVVLPQTNNQARIAGNNLQDNSQNNQEVDNSDEESQDNSAQSNRNQNAQNNQNTQNTNLNTVSANTFTLATLALHNKSGDCYVAYKGKVYNLSNSAAWANCQHHGGKGGVDVTSIFPHPVSYFDTLPVVGTMTASNNQTSNQNQNAQNNQNQNNNQSNQSQNTTSASTSPVTISGNTAGSATTNPNPGIRNQIKGIWEDDDEDFSEHEEEGDRKAVQTQRSIKSGEREDED